MSRLWILNGCLSLLFGCAPVVIAATQAPAPEPTATLESIQITGSSHFRPEQILQAIGLHAGTSVTRDDLQKAANDLARLGPFRSVQYRFASSGNGVAAEYQVVDAPTVPVRYDNFPWFTDDEITAALRASVVLFDGTAPENGSILDAMAKTIQGMLAARGVQSGVVHALTRSPFGNGTIQEFRADNSAVTVASVQFTDSLAEQDRGIHTRLGDLIDKPYSRGALELFEFEQVRPVYLSHALLHVQFAPPKVQLSAGPGANRAAVVLPVDPGTAFTWEGVTWSGALAITPAELDGFVGLQKGAPADGTKIEAIWEAAREAYAKRGYLDAVIAATPQFKSGQSSVAYVASVTEGPQYHMGQLILSGLSEEGERRIRGAWPMAPGAAFDKSYYDQFLQSGITRALMGLPFHYDKIGRYLQKNPQNATVDILLDFE